MRKIATASSDLKEIVENDYLYVDKTAFLYDLVSNRVDARYFIARPRRFGKSLMLSTLERIFAGDGKLFAGFNIASKGYDFSDTYPIVHLDMTTCQANSADAVEKNLTVSILSLIRQNGVNIPNQDQLSVGALFGAFLEELSRCRDKKIVVLVDEYDAPVTGLWNDTRERYGAQRVLHDFYIQLKAKDRYIRFLMMTGVTKLAKLSVFSGLNNLIDLTMRPEYSGMLGYTEDEISTCLNEQIEAFAVIQKKPVDAIRDELFEWYDSYRFSPRSEVRVCNPVSIGKALCEGVIKNYWEETGNSTIVYQALRDQGLTPLLLESVTITEQALDVTPLDRINLNTFLFQTGYLTIKNVKSDGLLTLGIPNKAIRDSFDKGFMEYWVGRTCPDYETKIVELRRRLNDVQVVDEVLKRHLYVAFAMLPYEWMCRSEAEAKRMFLFFCHFIGADIRGEQESAIGRADAILELKERVYIFEFKYNGSSVAALQQAEDKKYADRYMTDSRSIYLVGVNYDSSARNIDEPAVKLVDFSDGSDESSGDWSD